MVIGIAAFAFQRLGLAPSNKPTQQTPNILRPNNSLLESTFSNTDSKFSCDGRQHCSQMTSRAEAVYFINYCPNTKMDGDRDGIPCENNSRF